ncbi:TetR/AcrR family transcriptional regulator [Pedobacter kyonggii]|uniref:TetR/AcrR family transcriptional regulator n=1 Tax=Pedobacter kyonggii TaxID=1926871 RepID=A0A4V2JH64_9SPHI|nr:helix-turn-helix domain-containing protein [Pedobacter kyonggii]TBO43966.1 TetR/AcrR family transcriptional regulator [Pedobacter kyonggii]
MLNRSTIIDAAIQLFLHFGIKKTPLKDIAKSLRVSIPSLYWYFKNKDELVICVLEKITNEERILIEKQCIRYESLSNFIDELVEIKRLTFEKYSRLYHSPDYLRKIGFLDNLDLSRRLCVIENVNLVSKSVFAKDDNSPHMFKEILIQFLRELDLIFLNDATTIARSLGSDIAKRNGISDLISQKARSFLSEILDKNIMVQDQI